MSKYVCKLSIRRFSLIGWSEGGPRSFTLKGLVLNDSCQRPIPCFRVFGWSERAYGRAGDVSKYVRRPLIRRFRLIGWSEGGPRSFRLKGLVLNDSRQRPRRGEAER